ncbi:hypothetical protein ACFZAD_35175 [Streptomyces iakyrus]|uniref:hypothetical protein n=1 Tax=Streptomyces iakyrus TaxID=68219 RepID=UPI0036E74A85
MARPVNAIRSIEDSSLWPRGTREVSYIGSACVVEGANDFDHHDLTLIRRRFPDRHVTLDGDTITVWPQPREMR